MRCRMMLCLAALAAGGCLPLGGCIVAPPRPVYVAAAPVRVWMPGYWYGDVWVRGHWRYRER